MVTGAPPILNELPVHWSIGAAAAMSCCRMVALCE